MVCFLSPKQNQDRKHRTYVYVLTVTETLEAWEDSVNIGTCQAGMALVTTVYLTCHFTAVSKCICLLFTTLEEILCKYYLI